jgi:hypothetical protein
MKSPKQATPLKASKRPGGRAKTRANAIPLRKKTALTSGASPEMLSLEENAEKFVRYAGEWLLLAGGRLMAHSRDYAAILGEIERRGVKDGLVYYVPKPEESDFVLI